RHILKNLISVGVLDKSPRTLSPKIYFEIEQKFKDFSDEIIIPMDEFDLLFWSMESGEILK
ncbi:MAG: DNA lyase, partial [Bacteroidota bacterium]